MAEAHREGCTVADPKVVAQIIAIGKRRGETKKRILAALETGKVESNFQNLNYGDADSKGWRQERASLYKNPTNLQASINRFYDETHQFDKPGISAGELAARVQRPAAQFRGRYDQARSAVLPLLRGVQGGGATFNNSGQQGASTTRIPGFNTPGINLPSVAGTSVNIVEPQVDQAGFEDARRRSVLGEMIAKHNPNSFLLRSGLLSTQEPVIADYVTNKTSTVKIPGIPGLNIPGSRLPGLNVTTPGQPAANSSGSGQTYRGRTGAVKITGPNPGRIQPKVRNFAAKIAGVAGQTVVGSDGTGHSKFTTNGNISEHWTGAAMDIPARGSQLVKLGQAALIAAGKNPAWARKQTKGLFNVTVGGRRYQIIFGTNSLALGGDHTDHLHIGVRG
jgi:hypothetical protein